ncbi:hypothetical protein E4U21_002293 [Claviceps maximensis]|nr:hypothetical protein E4U21_002293 [Claviceps maximensis]
MPAALAMDRAPTSARLEAMPCPHPPSPSPDSSLLVLLLPPPAPTPAALATDLALTSPRLEAMPCPLCKTNKDAGCYCPNKEFVNVIFNCIYAHGENDNTISEAISFFQGMCGPYIPQNPAIATGCKPIIEVITVTGTPRITNVPYTMINYPGPSSGPPVQVTVPVIAMPTAPPPAPVGGQPPAAQPTGPAPAPGAGQPPAPGAGQPPAPGAGQPPAPGAGQPPAPGAGQPAAPGAGQPVAPGAVQPAAPGAGQPAAPGAGQPAAPGAGQPSPPDAVPYAPAPATPASPAGGEPVGPAAVGSGGIMPTTTGTVPVTAGAGRVGAAFQLGEAFAGAQTKVRSQSEPETEIELESETGSAELGKTWGRHCGGFARVTWMWVALFMRT